MVLDAQAGVTECIPCSQGTASRQAIKNVPLCTTKPLVRTQLQPAMRRPCSELHLGLSSTYGALGALASILRHVEA